VTTDRRCQIRPVRTITSMFLSFCDFGEPQLWALDL